jgi:hypothetical protein
VVFQILVVLVTLVDLVILVVLAILVEDSNLVVAGNLVTLHVVVHWVVILVETVFRRFVIFVAKLATFRKRR